MIFVLRETGVVDNYYSKKPFSKIQEWIDGHVIMVTENFYGQVLCNEDAIPLSKKLNELASSLTGIRLYGTVVVLTDNCKL